MTRTLAVGSTLLPLAFLLAACSGGAEVAKGDAKAVAPGADNTGAAVAAVDPRVAIADTNRIQGNPAAKVWLVMASDFQCPACKQWHETEAPEIMRDYVATGKLRFAYINFPLDMHPNARPASEAAMCAAAQGKFWGVHDRLFEKQPEWFAMPDPVPMFRRLVAEAGVDTVAWNQCLADDVMVPLIDGDYARGKSGGVDRTPSFFVGDRRIGGGIPAKNLRPLLDSALARAGATP